MSKKNMYEDWHEQMCHLAREHNTKKIGFQKDFKAGFVAGREYTKRELETEVQALVEALEFYASQDNWTIDRDATNEANKELRDAVHTVYGSIVADTTDGLSMMGCHMYIGGTKAREALANFQRARGGWEVRKPKKWTLVAGDDHACGPNMIATYRSSFKTGFKAGRKDALNEKAVREMKLFIRSCDCQCGADDWPNEPVYICDRCSALNKYDAAFGALVEELESK